MDLLRRLGETDNRVLYVLLVLVLLIPMVKPLGLPLQVSDATRNTFNIVEKLKPGDTVIFDFGYYVDGGPDVQPNAVALFEYLFSKDIKIICFSYKSHGPMIVDDLTAKYEAAGKQYGVDFVNMGYWQVPRPRWRPTLATSRRRSRKIGAATLPQRRS